MLSNILSKNIVIFYSKQFYKKKKKLSGNIKKLLNMIIKNYLRWAKQHLIVYVNFLILYFLPNTNESKCTALRL